ncbi:MAG: hypothetical protein QOJ01_1756 [Solirubrobacterales bacterium]|jgi:hypothetical protein|nr:hypothetical protein [Solirubrobacterales bacterium]
MGKDTEELSLIATPLPSTSDASTRFPLENPAVDVRSDDSLLEPRTDEPGVGKDGDCFPIENPASGKH